MTHTRTIRIATTDVLVDHLVRHLGRAVEAAVAARGRCTLAIPGGSVAAAVLPVLSHQALPWRAVHLFWCDERAVSLDDPDSNAGSALRFIANSPLAAQATLHVMYGDAQDLLRAANDYAALLTAVSGLPPVIDVVLLGVGEDGHVASLFPEHAVDCDGQQPHVLCITRAPKAPPKRLTLALPVLTSARDTIVMAIGSSKATAVHAALEGTSSHSPLARVVRESHRLLLLLDPHAAEQLEHTAVEYIA